MPLSEVKPGMRCTGLSVIKGTEISSFNVDIVDVIAAETGLSGPRILIRVSGPAVDDTGIGPGGLRRWRLTVRQRDSGGRSGLRIGIDCERRIFDGDRTPLECCNPEWYGSRRDLHGGGRIFDGSRPWRLCRRV